MEKKVNRNPLDGITIANKPLEDHLKSQESNDLLEAMSNHHYFKKKRKERYKEMTEENGPVTHKTAREVVIENFMKEAKQNKEKIIARLLIGQELCSKDVKKILEIKNRTDASRTLRTIYESELGQYMTRTVKGRIYFYKLNQPQRFTVDNALKLSDSKKTKPSIDKAIETPLDEKDEKPNVVIERALKQIAKEFNANLNISGRVEFIFKIER